MSSREITNTTVGLGFLVVMLAGLSTGLGAAIVFFPRFVKFATRRVLASSLGISTGVMLYVSFIEIFAKSKYSFDQFLIDSYEDEDRRHGIAYLYASLSFFLGVGINCVSDLCMIKI